MELEVLSFEQAKCLELIGYPHDVENAKRIYAEGRTKTYCAPYQEEAAKWFREKHKLFICVTPYTENRQIVGFEMCLLENDGHTAAFKHGMKTYEEALSHGITEAIGVVGQRNANNGYLNENTK